MRPVLGLHHITAICGTPQENVDFYVGILGMRLVKRSVNQDDPFTYHLFYADAIGTPGTDLTFFPWDDLPRGQEGIGVPLEVALAVPEGTLDYWEERLRRYGVTVGERARRFGEPVLPCLDPHGLRLALVEVTGREAVPWDESPVPPEKQVLGLHSARIVVHDLARTARFLTDALGCVYLGSEGGWHRYGVAGGGSGRFVEVRQDPTAPLGQYGIGVVHHIAWRVTDEVHQQEVRRQVIAAGRQATPVIDRFWFKSVYFREPGGVLFELATDGPGFAVDEDIARLGESLVLPPWLAPRRAEIEARLPRLIYPPVVEKA